MDLPVVDLDIFRHDCNSVAAQEEAHKTARALIEYGCLVVRDSRVTDADNEEFLDLMEDYFAQPQAVLEKDTRPELHFQVGATLENTEKPICSVDMDCRAIIEALDPSERPLDISQVSLLLELVPSPDLFLPSPAHDVAVAVSLTEMGEPSPTATQPPLENIVPEAFKQTWKPKMDRWGTQMKNAVEGVAQMLAQGLGLPKDTFTDAGKYGSHLLAPTATDLSKYGQLGDIMAGFHSDLDFLTIHGKSRYPGLHIWARNTGKKLAVKVPQGCLLVQSAQQLEHVTGGHILAGFHEVVVTPATLKAVEKRRKEAPGRPLIRISSTFFYHMSPDHVLEPLPSFRTAESVKKYPAMTAAEQVQSVLRQISLAQS